MFENRTRPVLYYSPDNIIGVELSEIEFSCEGSGSLSRILVGAYITDSGRLTGDLGPVIQIYESGTDIDSDPLHGEVYTDGLTPACMAPLPHTIASMDTI